MEELFWSIRCAWLFLRCFSPSFGQRDVDFCSPAADPPVLPPDSSSSAFSDSSLRVACMNRSLYFPSARTPFRSVVSFRKNGATLSFIDVRKIFLSYMYSLEQKPLLSVVSCLINSLHSPSFWAQFRIPFLSESIECEPEDIRAAENVVNCQLEWTDWTFCVTHGHWTELKVHPLDTSICYHVSCHNSNFLLLDRFFYKNPDPNRVVARR